MIEREKEGERDGARSEYGKGAAQESDKNNYAHRGACVAVRVGRKATYAYEIEQNGTN